MDCCNKDEKNEYKTENKEMKGGKMDKKVILWIIIAILIIAVVYIVFFNGGNTGNVVTTAQSAGQVASSGMVGGC